MIIGHHSSLEVTIAYSGELMKPARDISWPRTRSVLSVMAARETRGTKNITRAASSVSDDRHLLPVAVSTFGDRENENK